MEINKGEKYIVYKSGSDVKVAKLDVVFGYNETTRKNILTNASAIIGLDDNSKISFMAIDKPIKGD